MRKQGWALTGPARPLLDRFRPPGGRSGPAARRTLQRRREGAPKGRTPSAPPALSRPPEGAPSGPLSRPPEGAPSGRTLSPPSTLTAAGGGALEPHSVPPQHSDGRRRGRPRAALTPPYSHDRREGAPSSRTLTPQHSHGRRRGRPRAALHRPPALSWPPEGAPSDRTHSPPALSRPPEGAPSSRTHSPPQHSLTAAGGGALGTHSLPPSPSTLTVAGGGALEPHSVSHRHSHGGRRGRPRAALTHPPALSWFPGFSAHAPPLPAPLRAGARGVGSAPRSGPRAETGI
ncbi:proline-rich protein HaeIII subfamily 1-like [Tachyglossus aculeatus]|uniref:proline-rich protein HaeIII subfamily 1-like n=1 Tax=Tachyglossus aculeatus TaxID=9261 RepID=UPI0018F78ED3|nr:proline-rich protein HaeIII subfamily 1-like [Tachyglossus aculeatus]